MGATCCFNVYSSLSYNIHSNNNGTTFRIRYSIHFKGEKEIRSNS